MAANELREKFIKFFKSEPRNHEEIKAAPLVSPDPTTLFTSAGMQPLVPYLMGKPHPKGKRLVNSQPSLRLEDIEEVGDSQHTTFFEMLGNWSLGDYFKEEQLAWFYEFLTKELDLSPGKLYVTCFEGSKGVPRDDESAGIWKKLGVPEERIYFYGVHENWWSRTGSPEDMQPGDIGGPDSEVFYDFGIDHNPDFGKECHPTCKCGRFLEIGNSVFIEYQKREDGSLKELPQKNVDFGGGLERLAAAVKNNPDVFQIDLIAPLIKIIEEVSGSSYSSDTRSMRIIADHLRAVVFIASEGVNPSKEKHGYVLRRLIRRAYDHIHGRYDPKSGSVTTTSHQKQQVIERVISETIGLYMKSPGYEYLGGEKASIIEVVRKEISSYEDLISTTTTTLPPEKHISGKKAFELHSTYGFSPEQLHARGYKFSQEEYDRELEKHRELSRTASAGMFRGGLADTSENTVRLHTATHLLHAALRKVLGDHVEQKGSNITAERLRFDFSHPKKLTEEEIKKVEDLVNEQIKKDLPVSWEEKTMDEALEEGALAFFGEKYGSQVKVYTIGPSTGSGWFSKEVCGGPHVGRTGELGHVTITKEESAGSGVRRIYAEIG